MKAKLSAANKGRIPSMETRQKMRESRLRYVNKQKDINNEHSNS